MRRLPKGSLPLRVLTIGFLVFAVPLMVYFLVIYFTDYQRDMKSVLVGLEELAEGRAGILASANREALQAIDVIEALAKQKEGNLTEILTAVDEGANLVRAFYVKIEEGGYFATATSDPEMLGEDLSNEWPLHMALEEGQISSLGLSTERFQKLLYVTKRVDGDKGPVGFIVVAADIANVWKKILSSPGFAYPVNSSVLSAEGEVFASSDPDLLLQILKVGESGAELKMVPIEGVGGAYLIHWQGGERIAIKVPVEGTHFSFVVDADRAEVFAHQNDRLLHTVVIFFVLLAVGGGIALYLTQKLAVPLGHLREVMHKVSYGDLSARFIPKPMGFEINQIGLIFNETVETLSQNMARANAEKIERETLQKELDIGQEIQKSILPISKPTFPGLDIGARYLPSKQVGGDFYDVFVKAWDGNDVVLTVADASGKGISACLYSLCIRSMIRSYSAREEELSDIIREANNVFCEDTADTGMFVTAFSALYRPKDKRLFYSSSGHNPAYLKRAGGELIELQGKGVALGIMQLDEVEVDEIQLASGDLLTLYTDGVTETHNSQLQLFGDERLKAYLQKDHPSDAGKIADRLIEELQAFGGGHPQHDDITIMIVRVE